MNSPEPVSDLDETQFFWRNYRIIRFITLKYKYKHQAESQGLNFQERVDVRVGEKKSCQNNLPPKSIERKF